MIFVSGEGIHSRFFVDPLQNSELGAVGGRQRGTGTGRPVE